jgi:hypothetical protein
MDGPGEGFSGEALGIDGALAVAHRCEQQRQVRGTEKDGDYFLLWMKTSKGADIVAVITKKDMVYIRLKSECPWLDVSEWHKAWQLGPYPNGPDDNN